MDDVITRIIEIEKKSSLDIERSENTSRKNIEAHRLALEEEKERTHTLIISTENSRLTEAIQALNKQTEEASLAAVNAYEIRLQDPARVEAVKGKIVAILLAG